MGDSLHDARIMIVDDEPANVELLRQVLRRSGYTNVRGFGDPRAARTAYAAWQPDLLLLDLHMPHMTGVELAMRLREDAAGRAAPVIMLTADNTIDARRESLATIARDYITKPFDIREAMLRIEKVLHAQMEQTRLEETIATGSREVEAARWETLERLALAAEYRDHEGQDHAWRVGRTSALLARELSLPPTEAKIIGRAAVLHDVGKIGIADRVLLKNGRLDAVERALMQEHTVIGASILAGSSSELLRVGEVIAATHHERCDGNGYPAGTPGHETPLPGRIVAVADVFDALTHARPYKPAWDIDRACSEIRAGAGSQFDPDVVECFGRLEPRELLGPVVPGA
jgi:putative two-component system response regulator